MLEQMNSVTLKDLQSELSSSGDVFEILAELSDTIQKEKRDQSKSIGKDRTLQENNMLRRQLEDLQDRLREYELNRTNHLTSKGKDSNMSKIMKDLDEAERQLEEQNRVRDQLEYENRRLREEIKYLEENARKRPNSQGRPDSADPQQVSAIMLLRKECEGLKVENRGLKERIQQLNMELDAAVQQAVNAQKRPTSANTTPNNANAIRALE